MSETKIFLYIFCLNGFYCLLFTRNWVFHQWKCYTWHSPRACVDPIWSVWSVLDSIALKKERSKLYCENTSWRYGRRFIICAVLRPAKERKPKPDNTTAFFSNHYLYCSSHRKEEEKSTRNTKQVALFISYIVEVLTSCSLISSSSYTCFVPN